MSDVREAMARAMAREAGCLEAYDRNDASLQSAWRASADLETLLAKLSPAERDEWNAHLTYYGTASLHEDKDGNVRVVPPWELFVHVSTEDKE